MTELSLSSHTEIQESIVGFSFNKYLNEKIEQQNSIYSIQNFLILYNLNALFQMALFNKFRKKLNLPEITLKNQNFIQYIKKGIDLIFQDFDDNIIIADNLMWVQDSEKYTLYKAFSPMVPQNINFLTFYTEGKNKYIKTPTLKRQKSTDSMISMYENRREEYPTPIMAEIPISTTASDPQDTISPIASLLVPEIKKKIERMMQVKFSLSCENLKDEKYISILPELIQNTYHLYITITIFGGENREEKYCSLSSELIKKFGNKIDHIIINYIFRCFSNIFSGLSQITSRGSLADSVKFKNSLILNANLYKIK